MRKETEKKPRLLDLDTPVGEGQAKQKLKTYSRPSKKPKASTQESTEPQFVLENPLGEKIDIQTSATSHSRRRL